MMRGFEWMKYEHDVIVGGSIGGRGKGDKMKNKAKK